MQMDFSNRWAFLGLMVACILGVNLLVVLFTPSISKMTEEVHQIHEEQQANQAELTKYREMSRVERAKVLVNQQEMLANQKEFDAKAAELVLEQKESLRLSRDLNERLRKTIKGLE